MKKINLILLGADTTYQWGTAAYCYPDGQTPENKRAFIFSRYSGISAVECFSEKNDIFSLYSFDYLRSNDIQRKNFKMNLSGPDITNNGGDALFVENVPVLKRNGINPPTGMTISISPFSFIIAISTGNDKDSGNSLIYCNGIDPVNSKNFITYEVGYTIQELYNLMTTNPS